MLRKQIYLTPQIDRELTIRARGEGKSVAEVVRESLARDLGVENKRQNAGEFLLELASDAASGGPKDLSTNLFDYLYGDKSPNYGKNKPKLTKKEIEHINRFVNDRSK
ncbi:MAG: hypothetical protein HYW33_01455 [Candidatus Blackburnbacteria bacterium]|nr:hypothetical protein [Candidatus Blackburnbacteria bacterium]